MYFNRRFSLSHKWSTLLVCHHKDYVELNTAPCCQHRTVPDFDVAAICHTPGRSCWVRLPSNIKEKGMGCLASRRKGVLVFWWLGRDGTDRTGACTSEKN